MTTPRTPDQAARRHEGIAQAADEKLPTYQELLDTAVEDTFPASDPISPSAALHTGRPVETPMDTRDWKLKPTGAHPEPAARDVVAEFDDPAAARQAQQQVLSVEMPTARLDLAGDGQAEGPRATLTVVVDSDDEQDRAMQIARQAGATRVTVRSGTH
jgi:hypothetical protein